MYDLKKSDAVIVAVKQANNGRSTPCGVSGAKGRNRGEFGRLKDAPYSVCGESVMEVDRIRKAAKRNPEGCPTFRVLPAQRVGVPKPIEASRDQHPTGRWKRPLGTARRPVRIGWSDQARSKRIRSTCKGSEHIRSAHTEVYTWKFQNSGPFRFHKFSSSRRGRCGLPFFR